MTWLQIKFQVSAQESEKLIDLLDGKGALAVTLQDAGNQPLYEPTPGTVLIWDNVFVTALFEVNTDIQKIIATLQHHFHTPLHYSLHYLEEQDWEQTWMNDFQSMKFGERLRIVPSYQKSSAPSPYEVILDPGLAFGTGTHPTTALCLEWLDKNINEPFTVIDYGCGSGILGIAAIKLGASVVYAVDNDPQAITATQNNAAQNNLSSSELLTLFPEQVNEIRADVLIANILANPLLELSSHFAKLVKQGGRIVLSGILLEQATRIIEAYQQWFRIQEVVKKEEWVRIDGIKTN